MHEIIFKWAEMRKLIENARDSHEMRETWQVCLSKSKSTAERFYLSNSKK